MDQQQENTKQCCIAKELVANPQGPDDSARVYLALGCANEHDQDWDGAIENYRRALAEAPTNPFLQYFSNNNLGFSLIQKGCFDEAEKYCEAAIEINEERHNAHKNLGLVRQGQGRWLDAALCFVSASRLNPRDPRALWHLQKHLAERPQLLRKSAELREEAGRLRNAMKSGGCAQVH